MAQIDIAKHLAFDSEEEHARFMSEEGLPLLVLYRSIRDRDLRRAIKAVLQSIVDSNVQGIGRSGNDDVTA